jgi:hypothetical protein
MSAVMSADRLGWLRGGEEPLIADSVSCPTMPDWMPPLPCHIVVGAHELPRPLFRALSSMGGSFKPQTGTRLAKIIERLAHACQMSRAAGKGCGCLAWLKKHGYASKSDDVRPPRAWPNPEAW